MATSSNKSNCRCTSIYPKFINSIRPTYFIFKHDKAKLIVIALRYRRQCALKRHKIYGDQRNNDRTGDVFYLIFFFGLIKQKSSFGAMRSHTVGSMTCTTGYRNPTMMAIKPDIPCKDCSIQYTGNQARCQTIRVRQTHI